MLEVGLRVKLGKQLRAQVYHVLVSDRNVTSRMQVLSQHRRDHELNLVEVRSLFQQLSGSYQASAHGRHKHLVAL